MSDAAALIESLSALLALLAQERSALESSQADAVHAISAQKTQITARVEALMSKKEQLEALSPEQRERVTELGLAVQRDAKANAMIASGALAMSMAKLHFIAELSSDSYGPDGKPKNPMGRGSWAASA